MKRKRGFASDFCMDCCALLLPYSKICPVCGADNSWLPLQDEPLDDAFISRVPDDPEFDLDGGSPDSER